MLKRLASILCLILATSVITVTTAGTASADHHHMRCFNDLRDTWVGVNTIYPLWDRDARLARVEIRYHVCVSHRHRNYGQVIHRKSSFTMDIYNTGYGDNAGVYFHHNAARVEVNHDYVGHYIQKEYIHGWWHECGVVETRFTCGPTGDFTYVWTFRAPWLVRHHGGTRWLLYRRAGEPYKSAGSYDRQVRFYNSG